MVSRLSKERNSRQTFSSFDSEILREACEGWTPDRLVTASQAGDTAGMIAAIPPLVSVVLHLAPTARARRIHPRRRTIDGGIPRG